MIFFWAQAAQVLSQRDQLYLWGSFLPDGRDSEEVSAAAGGTPMAGWSIDLMGFKWSFNGIEWVKNGDLMGFKGFHNWGYPKNDGLFHGKSESKMD